MTKINLLPWREEAREHQRKVFLGKLFATTLIAIVLVLSPLVHKQALTLAEFNPAETMKSIQPIVVKIESTILDITGEKINATEYVQNKIKKFYK